MTKITIDGNTATAKIAYKMSEIATIYPITPSSPMAEYCDEMSAKGEKNIYGDVVRVVEMQSEGGASGALHGALSSGAMAKMFLAETEVMVNGEKEDRRGRKLYPGDIVEVLGQKYQVK